MKKLSTAATFVALIALAACANNPNRPTDTGNMALPATGAAGVVTSPPVGRDVGSVGAPAGNGGVVSRTATPNRTPDTGNMALPSAAQGNSTPRSY